MIYIFNGEELSQREPIHATWIGGTTTLLYSNGTNQAFGKAPITLGTAMIERTAAYSYFPGFTRLHMPLNTSIRLCFQQPAEQIVLAPRNAYCFDGARPLVAELIDQPIYAFNVMVQTGIQATLTVGYPKPAMPLFADSAPATLRICYLLQGQLEISMLGQLALPLMANDTLVQLSTNSKQPLMVASASLDALAVFATIQDHQLAKTS
jgi:environmental stress-induced protein Ves